MLEDENDGAVNRWAAEYYTMLHMTNDSGLFEDKEALERTLGLPARRFWNGDSQSELRGGSRREALQSIRSQIR